MPKSTSVLQPTYSKCAFFKIMYASTFHLIPKNNLLLIIALSSSVRISHLLLQSPLGSSFPLSFSQHNPNSLHRPLDLGPPIGLGKLEIVRLQQILLGKQHVLLLVKDVPQFVQIIEGLSPQFLHGPLTPDLFLHPLEAGD